MSSREFSFLILNFNDVNSIRDVDRFHSDHGFTLDSEVRDWLISNLHLYKYWILDPITGNMIAAVCTEEPDKVILSNCMIEEVFKIASTPKVKTMTLDSILDKISEVRFDNLNQDEKDFLKNQSEES